MSFCGFLIAIVALLGTSAVAQSTQPATPAANAFENEPLKFGTSAGRIGEPKSAQSSSPSSLDASRVGLALMIVIGVIFLLRWAGRKMFLLPGVVKANPAIKVLSRTVLSPKQQVMLLQVGKRLVVVGDSGGHLAALSEITDPDEVAGLVGEVSHTRSDRQGSTIKSFRNLFGLAKQPFDDAPVELESNEAEESPADQELLTTHQEIGGLLEKVKLMQRQFKRS